MNDDDFKQKISPVDYADKNVDLDFVTGVFTSNAALLVSRGYLISHPVASVSEAPNREDAFYVYYYDSNLEWMYSVDESGEVRFMSTYCKRIQSTGCETEVEAASYQEVC